MTHTDVCDGVVLSDRQETLLQANDSLLDPSLFERPQPARGARPWWTPQRLVLVLMLMAWGKGSEALTDRLATVRGLWPEEKRGQTYQGFIKAWLGVGLGLVYAAAQRLRQVMVRELDHAGATIHGWVVLAADGSHFELARTAEHLRVFGTVGKGSNCPQLWVTMLWHLGLGLPWAWKIGPADASERHHLRAMLGLAPLGCLLAMDAGFTGYELLAAILAGQRHFLVRVGRQVKLLSQLGYAHVERDGTVYLWPTYAQRHDLPPLVLRLVRLPRGQGGQRKMYLLTSVTDPARLSDEQAATIYRLRWGIELTYRAMKQTLQARKLRSHAPAQALLEMHGLLLGLTVLGLWTQRAILAQGGDPRRWSVAGALRRATRALYRPERCQDWMVQLAGAVKDGYTRRRKTRVVWPRKKQHDPPPGRPHLRKATEAERRRAAALLQK